MYSRHNIWVSYICQKVISAVEKRKKIQSKIGGSVVVGERDWLQL